MEALSVGRSMCIVWCLDAQAATDMRLRNASSFLYRGFDPLQAKSNEVFHAVVSWRQLVVLGNAKLSCYGRNLCRGRRDSR